MKIELLEGETLCHLCNGTGHDKQALYICDKCDGEGKVDWISKAITASKKMSSLRLLNIKRAFISMENIAMNNFPDVKLIYKKIKKYSELLKNNHVIYDYLVIHDKTNNFNFDIYIQPSRTVEQCKLTLRISKDEC